MQKWEYMTVFLDQFFNYVKPNDDPFAEYSYIRSARVMNICGKDGWELVSVSPEFSAVEGYGIMPKGFVLVFKRPTS